MLVLVLTNIPPLLKSMTACSTALHLVSGGRQVQEGPDSPYFWRWRHGGTRPGLSGHQWEMIIVVREKAAQRLFLHTHTQSRSHCSILPKQCQQPRGRGHLPPLCPYVTAPMYPKTLVLKVFNSQDSQIIYFHLKIWEIVEVK